MLWTSVNLWKTFRNRQESNLQESQERHILKNSWGRQQTLQKHTAEPARKKLRHLPAPEAHRGWVGEGLPPPLSHHSDSRNGCFLPEAWLSSFCKGSLSPPYTCWNPRHIPALYLQERLLEYKTSTVKKFQNMTEEECY